MDSFIMDILIDISYLTLTFRDTLLYILPNLSGSSFIFWREIDSITLKS